MIENYGFAEIDEILDAEYSFLDSDETDSGEGISMPSELKSSLERYATQINADIEGMSDAEVEEYMEIAWAPIIGSLVSALAPVAINAVGGLIGNLTKSRQAARPASPPTPQRAPRPAQPRPATTQTQARPAGTTNAGAGSQLLNTLRGLGSGAISQLASLLQNPNVINAISNVATTGINAAVAGNNTTTTATPTARDAIDAIHHLSSEIIQNIPETDQAIPEYMYSEGGELLGDPYSPAERAAVLVEYLGI